MMYSAAIYPKESSSQEEASYHKLETICKKLDLRSSDRVIEIGFGWSSSWGGNLSLAYAFFTCASCCDLGLGSWRLLHGKPWVNMLINRKSMPDNEGAVNDKK